MSYPRVLIVAIGRINAADTANNGLLLRNLFGGWPRENLAQIYSGGSNGDEGFCGHQYPIVACDRRFGKYFFKLKGEHVSDLRSTFNVEESSVAKGQKFTNKIKSLVGAFVQDSGLYELIFKINPSDALYRWVKEFDPDIILAQGYNLSFIWLPLMLKRRFNTPMAFYNSDDWPTYLYASRCGLSVVTAPFLRRLVDRSTKELIAATDAPFAFNDMMGDEYQRRYGKSFITLMHCDDPERFFRAQPIRLQPLEVHSILATGAFDDSRWPLLLDLEEACHRLNNMGIPVQATVLAVHISKEGYRRINSCQFVKLQDDPGHELLPSYLKGADLLYLPETFDPHIAQGYQYSISTKAHLFMFSQRPILVYGHPACGLVNYAKRDGWAYVVEEQNIDFLVEALRSTLIDNEQRKKRMQAADQVAMRNNDCAKVRNIFHSSLLAIAHNS